MVVGIDSHKDNVAAYAVDELGDELVAAIFPNTSAGHDVLLKWARGAGKISTFGIEGSGGLGFALASHLAKAGERVVNIGSGAGMDSLLAALWVGNEGSVIGVDMTAEMLKRSRSMAEKIGLKNVEFREGPIEDLPVEDGWADVVIFKGVINLCPDKIGVYRQIFRVLKPGGRIAGAPDEASAREFGTLGYSIRARRTT